MSIETCFVKSIDAALSLTTSDAEAVLPGPPSFDITCTVLFFVPAVAPVTVTLNVHEAFAARDPPEKEIVLGSVDSEPPQVVVGPLVVTVRPLGKISINPMPDSEFDLFGLVIVNDKVVLSPVKIEPEENDLARTGGAITVREAVA